MNRNDLINNLHALYRQDEYIKEIFNSAGITLDNIESTMADIEQQYWLDTVTWGLSIWELILGIKANLNSSYEDRRSLVGAKWRGTGKADLYLLQVVANSWRNGSVLVEFVGGKIKLTFNGIYGIPTDLASLQAAIDDVKPAHLAIVYAFAYLFIADVESMTINELETVTLDKFAGGVV